MLPKGILKREWVKLKHTHSWSADMSPLNLQSFTWSSWVSHFSITSETQLLHLLPLPPPCVAPTVTMRDKMRIGQQSLGNNTTTLPCHGDMGTASVLLSQTAASRCQLQRKMSVPPIYSIVCVKIATEEMQECLRKGLDPVFSLNDESYLKMCWC